MSKLLCVIRIGSLFVFRVLVGLILPGQCLAYGIRMTFFDTGAWLERLTFSVSWQIRLLDFLFLLIGVGVIVGAVFWLIRGIKICFLTGTESWKEIRCVFTSH